VLFRWGWLSVGSKQGDVRSYLVGLAVQDGPYAFGLRVAAELRVMTMRGSLRWL